MQDLGGIIVVGLGEECTPKQEHNHHRHRHPTTHRHPAALNHPVLCLVPVCPLLGLSFIKAEASGSYILVSPLMMENQVGKQIKNEVETGVYRYILRLIV